MAYQATLSVHSDADRQKLRQRIHRALGLFGLLMLIAAAAVVAALIWRNPTQMNNPNEMPSQIIVTAVTLVFGAMIIFLWGMKMTPLLSYRKYLKEISSGLTRDVEGTIVSFDADTTFRDGVSFYALIVNIGDLQEPEDERLLYWDAQLPKPADIAPGDHVRFHAHGNDIIGYEKR